MFRFLNSTICQAALLGLVVLSPSAYAKYKVLYTFACGSDGCAPEAPLIFDGAGNLYGTTVGGGAHGYGTVFRLAPHGAESVLYSFKAGADGASPYAGVVMDEAGNLYGTTSVGGGSGCGGQGCGTVFKIAPDGSETVLHAFADVPDGANPSGGVVLDRKGNLYGTTVSGGTGTSCYVSCGTVFKLAPDGTETVLYSFQGGSDGGTPYASPIIDKAGNLYGTTIYAGSGNCISGCGVVFKVAPDGTETVLHAFDFSDGSYSYAPVIMDKSGNLYGTTGWGGPSGLGTAFKLAPDGTTTVLHAFPDSANDGQNPYAGLAFDGRGNLYGTTTQGGKICGNYGSSCGTIFKIGQDGTETIVHALKKGHGDGIVPYAGLAVDRTGNLFGTTSTTTWYRAGGTVFEVTQ